MDREILFKAKSIRTDKWCYGGFVKNRDGKCYIKDTDYNVNNGKIDIIPEEVYPETVCQFTGLFDSNNAKIFEGDVLADKNRKDWDKTNFVAYEVFYHDNDCCEYNVGFQMNRHHYNGAICGTSDFRKFTQKNVKKMEVISNVKDAVFA